VGPAGGVRTTSRTAAWLVLVFSLLSKKSEVVGKDAVTIKPLFGAPFSHACSWAVIGIER
jgi:hypothetical protein